MNIMMWNMISCFYSSRSRGYRPTFRNSKYAVIKQDARNGETLIKTKPIRKEKREAWKVADLKPKSWPGHLFGISETGDGGSGGKGGEDESDDLFGLGQDDDENGNEDDDEDDAEGKDAETLKH